MKKLDHQAPPFVHLRGTDAQSTVLSFDDYALKIGANGKAIGTNASHTLFVRGQDFEAENLTIENTAGPRKLVKSQTMAVGVQADRVIFRNCRLLAHQDTLLAGSGRQYFADCTIIGEADFIFGDAAAVFDRCEIRSNGGGVITAQERIVPHGSTGFVFNSCKFTSTSNVRKGAVYLGRPFRPCARVILLTCELGEHISPAGWVMVREGDYSQSAYFAEYNSTGDGHLGENRVSWSHQLNPDETSPFLPAAFLQGTDHWQPWQKNEPTSQSTTKP